jgi:hypothetical protein
MFFCQIYGFNKMALMIVCTIWFSFFYTLTFFTSAMIMFGPEFDQV